MRFGFKGWVRLASIVLLFGNSAAAGTAHTDSSEIRVLVYNSAPASPTVLKGAEIEAARILRAAGIAVVWLNCSAHSNLMNDSCRRGSASDEFVLHIVPDGKTANDFVFGLAFLDQEGTGKYSDVFLDRIEQAHRDFDLNMSRLLGAVAAHELGHLLLGSHAHSTTGIMTPRWEEDTLRSMNMGRLLFTHEQAARMQDRLETKTNELRQISLRHEP
jgi:hypothetical protein